MKNLINFYALIIFPLSTLGLLTADKLIGAKPFTLLLAIYCLLYHPLICGLRLIATNKITKQQLFYNFIPCWNWKYFAFLFFNSEG